VFLNWLYGNYNVVDHYEIAGNLYRKQGASWPLRVLVIAGRNQTENAYPSDFNVNRITTFDELWSRYVQTSDRSQEVVVGTGKKQPVTGGANRPAGGVPAGGTLEDGDMAEEWGLERALESANNYLQQDGALALPQWRTRKQLVQLVLENSSRILEKVNAGDPAVSKPAAQKEATEVVEDQEMNWEDFLT
jgi:hypothetical protein